MVLDQVKGWVLAMLAASAAARGSGPGAQERRPGPGLRAMTGGWCRDEGRPANRRQRALPGRRRTKGDT
jgi:hypothetical protein